MLIAELAAGAFVKGSSLQAGDLVDLKMSPEDMTVQKTTNLVITFTTTHSLKAEAAVTVRLPNGIEAPVTNAVLDVNSPDGSTSATTGTVKSGKIIQITNLVPVGAPDQAEGKTYSFVI
jgi:hypothetical protein